MVGIRNGILESSNLIVATITGYSTIHLVCTVENSTFTII